MHSFNHSQVPQTPKSSLHTFWSHPRFLRAIPSLMVLTTAIAWGASSHAGGLAIDGALRNGIGVNIAAGPALGAGVGSGLGVGVGVGVDMGANTGVKAGSGTVSGDAAVNAGAGVNADRRIDPDSNVTAEQRMSTMGAAASSENAPGPGSVDASGAAKAAIESTGRTLGNVRDTGQAAGSVAARTGQRATQGAKTRVKSGLKGAVGASTHGAAISGRTDASAGTDAAASVKGTTSTR